MTNQFLKTNEDNVRPATGSILGKSVANKHTFFLFPTTHFAGETRALTNTSPFFNRSLTKTAKLSI
jgi:hypothetical protein